MQKPVSPRFVIEKCSSGPGKSVTWRLINDARDYTPHAVTALIGLGCTVFGSIFYGWTGRNVASRRLANEMNNKDMMKRHHESDLVETRFKGRKEGKEEAIRELTNGEITLSELQEMMPLIIRVTKKRKRIEEDRRSTALDSKIKEIFG